jgi:hypothetical protein
MNTHALFSYTFWVATGILPWPHWAIRREFEPVGLNPAQEFCLWHVEAHTCVEKSCTALIYDG